MINLDYSVKNNQTGEWFNPLKKHFADNPQFTPQDQAKAILDEDDKHTSTQRSLTAWCDDRYEAEDMVPVLNKIATHLGWEGEARAPKERLEYGSFKTYVMSSGRVVVDPLAIATAFDSLLAEA